MTDMEDKDWLDVPYRIRELYIKHAGDALDIVRGEQKRPIIFTDVGPIVIHKEATAPFSTFGKAFGTAGRAMGGPNPLTSALLTGALTAGAGYGGGWLAEKLFPEKYMKRGPLKRNLAIGGGLLGALAGGYLHGKPLADQHGWRKAMLMRGTADLKPPEPGFWDTATTPTEPLKTAADKLGVAFEEDDFYKTAFSNAAGTVLPRIHKDEFNQMVLRDPYTSMVIRAGTMGLTEAASQAKGGANWISPLDIGRIAVGMGSGAVSGMMVGKVLGALAGLKPEAQQGLQRGGIMAGLLTNIIPQAFGR
jgi:hypothetical protein